MSTPRPTPPRSSSTPARLERINAFASAAFVKSVVDREGLPPESGPEIAFAGRSNAGKSSSINRLAGQTRLAYASKMPGRTRELNFFALRGGGHLVDLPGYGFARTPRDKQRVWTGVIEDYFRERAALSGIVLVLDVRHAPTDLDVQFVQWLSRLGVDRPPVLWLLNKADKLTQSERIKARNAFSASVEPLLGDDDHIVLFSAATGLGMKECDAVFANWLTPLAENAATSGD
ncbi:MAG: YihA family ribosome biogenesis GTP-binding protein [Burkholderiales bacterium]|nr:YihA family ribosome biogenesis GTP-binding protein [Burkholderiales bacterium]